MPATILRLPPGDRYEASVLEPPARALAGGGLVAFPTETLYGIAANARHPGALERLRRVTGATKDSRLTHYIADLDDLSRHVADIPPLGYRLLHAFWPGPLTLILRDRGGEPVALRYPSHPVALDLIRLARVPLVAPRADAGDEAPAVDASSLLAAWRDQVDYIIDGGATHHRGPSTVAEVRGRELIVHREGAIPAPRLRSLATTDILFVCTGNTCRSPMAEAIARAMLADRPHVDPSALPGHGYRVKSAGTAAYPGGSSTPEAEEAVRRYGASLEEHVSQPLTTTLVEEADHIFAMTAGHKATIEKWMPECTSKVRLLDPDGHDVEDPIGGSRDTYAAIAALIHRHLQRSLADL